MPNNDFKDCEFIAPPSGLVQAVKEKLDATILDCMQMSNGSCFVHAKRGTTCFCTIAHRQGDSWEDATGDIPAYGVQLMLDIFSDMCHTRRERMN
jgi:hypothetical protein